MQTTEILLIVNLIISFLTPIIISIIEIFKRVKKSKCLGSESVLSPDNSVSLPKVSNTDADDAIKRMSVIVERLDRRSTDKKNIDLV